MASSTHTKRSLSPLRPHQPQPQPTPPYSLAPSPSSHSSRQPSPSRSTMTGHAYWTLKLAARQAEDELILESGVENPFADPIHPTTSQVIELGKVGGEVCIRNLAKLYREATIQASRGRKPAVSASSPGRAHSMDSIDLQRVAWEYKPSSSSYLVSNKIKREEKARVAERMRVAQEESDAVNKANVNKQIERLVPRDDFAASAGKQKNMKGGKEKGSLRKYTLKTLKLGFGKGKKDGKGKVGMEEMPACEVGSEAESESEDEKGEKSLLGRKGKKEGTAWTSVLSTHLSKGKSNKPKANKPKAKIQSTTKKRGTSHLPVDFVQQ